MEKKTTTRSQARWPSDRVYERTKYSAGIASRSVRLVILSYGCGSVTASGPRSLRQHGRGRVEQRARGRQRVRERALRWARHRPKGICAPPSQRVSRIVWRSPSKLTRGLTPCGYASSTKV
eukprot:1299417-Prymnesium_polylepis.1